MTRITLTTKLVLDSERIPQLVKELKDWDQNAWRDTYTLRAFTQKWGFGPADGERFVAAHKRNEVRAKRMPVKG